MQIAALKDGRVCRLVAWLAFFFFLLPSEGLEGRREGGAANCYWLHTEGWEGCRERQERVVEPLHPSSSNTTHH